MTDVHMEFFACLEAMECVSVCALWDVCVCAHTLGVSVEIICQKRVSTTGVHIVW